MAEETEKLPFDFGIQNTMEMGIGDAQLLNDLVAPETATGNPEEVSPIIKEAEPAKPPKAPDVKKGKEIIPPPEDGSEPPPQDVLKNFLGDEEETKEENEETSPATPVEEESKEQYSQFNALSKDLFKLGVFVLEEGEEAPQINTPEEFLQRFNEEKQKGAVEMVDRFIGQFGDDYKDAFDAIYVKGVNPKDYFGIYNTIVDFAQLDLTVEDNQVAVVRQTLADQGLEGEDITTEIERLKNYGDLETVATKYHKVLVKKEAAKLAQKEQEAERELQQKMMVKAQYTQNVQAILQEKLKAKEFDGIPLNPKLANELQDFLLVDKWKTQSGETLTDFDRAILDLKRPENHSLKVKVALLLKILEKDPTLSTIQRAGVSKQADSLFSSLGRHGQPSKQEQPTKPRWQL